MPRLLSCPPLLGASPQVLTPHRNPSGALAHPMCLMATLSPQSCTSQHDLSRNTSGEGKKAKMGTRRWRGRSQRSRGTQTRLIPSLSDPFPRNPGVLQALFRDFPTSLLQPCGWAPTGREDRGWGCHGNRQH